MGGGVGGGSSGAAARDSQHAFSSSHRRRRRRHAREHQNHPAAVCFRGGSLAGKIYEPLYAQVSLFFYILEMS